MNAFVILQGINWYTVAGVAATVMATAAGLVSLIFNVKLARANFQLQKRAGEDEALQSTLANVRADRDELRRKSETQASHIAECEKRLVVAEAKTDLEQFERRMLDRFLSMETQMSTHSSDDMASARAVQAKFDEIKLTLANVDALVKTINENTRKGN